MKMNIKTLLLFSLTILLSACIEEEQGISIDKNHLDFQDQHIAKIGCCTNQDQFDYTITSTTSTANRVCCTYEITYYNGSTSNTNCSHYISTPNGIRKQAVGPGDSQTFNYEFCRNEGEFQSQIIFQSIIRGNSNGPVEVCQSLILDPFECATPDPECTFTYEQGLNTGCNIGIEEEDNGCCDPSCSNILMNTCRDFEDDCPEYVLGVKAGFEACNCTGGPNPDPNLCGGSPAPAQDCECINNNWECQ